MRALFCGLKAKQLFLESIVILNLFQDDDRNIILKKCA